MEIRASLAKHCFASRGHGSNPYRGHRKNEDNSTICWRSEAVNRARNKTSDDQVMQDSRARLAAGDSRVNSTKNTRSGSTDQHQGKKHRLSGRVGRSQRKGDKGTLKDAWLWRRKEGRDKLADSRAQGQITRPMHGSDGQPAGRPALRARRGQPGMKHLKYREENNSDCARVGERISAAIPKALSGRTGVE